MRVSQDDWHVFFYSVKHCVRAQQYLLSKRSVDCESSHVWLQPSEVQPDFGDAFQEIPTPLDLSFLTEDEEEGSCGSTYKGPERTSSEKYVEED